MDLASSSSTPGQPQGQPTYTFVPNTWDFSTANAVFSDIRGGVHDEPAWSGNVRLLSFS